MRLLFAAGVIPALLQQGCANKESVPAVSRVGPRISAQGKAKEASNQVRADASVHPHLEANRVSATQHATAPLSADPAIAIQEEAARVAALQRERNEAARVAELQREQEEADHALALQLEQEADADAEIQRQQDEAARLLELQEDSLIRRLEHHEKPARARNRTFWGFRFRD